MSYVKNIVKKFSENSNPENAKPMKAYLKNKFELFGIKTPQRKVITKEIIAEYGLPSEKEFEKVIRDLWEQPYREIHYFTLEIIGKLQKKLTADYMDLWEYLIVTNSWWDSVDGIAVNIMGTHFEKYPEQIKPITEKWINSGNMWLQRSALLFQLKYKDKTDTELLSDYIDKLKDSKEFFIRKAIGWILREYSKTNSDYVIKFVEINGISEFSKREALKWLNNRK